MFLILAGIPFLVAVYAAVKLRRTKDDKDRRLATIASLLTVFFGLCQIAYFGLSCEERSDSGRLRKRSLQEVESLGEGLGGWLAATFPKARILIVLDPLQQEKAAKTLRKAVEDGLAGKAEIVGSLSPRVMGDPASSAASPPLEYDTSLLQAAIDKHQATVILSFAGLPRVDFEDELVPFLKDLAAADEGERVAIALAGTLSLPPPELKSLIEGGQIHTAILKNNSYVPPKSLPPPAEYFKASRILVSASSLEEVRNRHPTIFPRPKRENR